MRLCIHRLPAKARSSAAAAQPSDGPTPAQRSSGQSAATVTPTAPPRTTPRKIRSASEEKAEAQRSRAVGRAFGLSAASMLSKKSGGGVVGRVVVCAIFC